VRSDFHADLNYAIGYGVAKERSGIGTRELQIATHENSAGETRTATEVVVAILRSSGGSRVVWRTVSIETQFSIFEVGRPENLQASATMSETFSYRG